MSRVRVWCSSISLSEGAGDEEKHCRTFSLSLIVTVLMSGHCGYLYRSKKNYVQSQK